MKQCIWCLKFDGEVTFLKEAHILPQSLGGKEICEKVCDICNSFFGSHDKGKDPIETILKETFNVSRSAFINSTVGFGKNKSLSRYKSSYFEVNWKNKDIKFKSEKRLKAFFSENATRLLKRGIYKVILESIEKKENDGINDKYNFIRQFARYDLNELPLFYFHNKIGFAIIDESIITNPSPIWFNELPNKLYPLRTTEYFIEFELFSYIFCVPRSPVWKLILEDHMKESMKFKTGYEFPIDIQSIMDIDITLKALK